MWQFLFQTLAATSCANKSFFGIPAWYKYLVSGSNPIMTLNSVTNACELTRINDPGVGWTTVIMLIALAIIDMLLRVAGLVAFGFILYGGARYITSTGLPDKTKEAQEAIINAIIGLAITVIAIAAVSFIGHRLGG